MSQASLGLSKGEIMRIVNRYIGVKAGYLGDFSYTTHADFYPEYCDVDIDPNSLEGTTRERFIKILETSSPVIQAKIIRGVLDRFPLDQHERPTTRTAELRDELISVVARLEGAAPVATPEPRMTSAVVLLAIANAENLIATDGVVSAVDRIHTALHGYLRQCCIDADIEYRRDDGLHVLFKKLRSEHPALQSLGPRQDDIKKILNSLSSILSALDPIRNNASVAHPNDELLGDDEAMLVVNASKTLMHYLDAKLGGKLSPNEVVDEIPF